MREGNNMKIDLSEFEVIKESKRKPASFVVSISKDGTFVINSCLLKELETLEIEVRLKPDCSQMTIRNEGEFKVKISKNGRMKNYIIKEKLEKSKIKLPVYYIVKWDEEDNLWFGDLAMSNPNSSSKKIVK